MLAIPFSEKNGKKAQRGDILLESLVSMVIVSIIGAGALHVAARGAVSHRYLDNQSEAVTQMRALLQRQGNGLCGNNSTSITVAKSSLAVTVNCTTTTSSVTVNGSSVAVSGTAATQVSLAASSAMLFGGASTVVVGE